MRERGSLADRLYLRGNTWWIVGYDDSGKRWRESTHQTDRKAAIAAATRLERERAVPTNRAAHTTTLEAALALVLAHDKRAGNSAHTIRFHTDKARHVVRVLGASSKIHTLTLADTTRYTDKRLEEGADLHTVQKEVRVLLQGLALAKEVGLYLGEPGSLKPRVLKKKASYYTPRHTWLTADQCRALLGHVSVGLQVRNIDRRDHVRAYLLTGVRKSELYQIHAEHVDLDKGTVWIAGTKTEQSARVVFLNAEGVELFAKKLARAKPGKPLFEPWASARRDLQNAWDRARKAAEKAAAKQKKPLTGWPEKISHNDLRRTYCSQLCNAGVPMQHAAKLLGHADLTMVQTIYGRLAPETLAAAVAKLPSMDLRTMATNTNTDSKSKIKRTA